MALTIFDVAIEYARKKIGKVAGQVDLSTRQREDFYNWYLNKDLNDSAKSIFTKENFPDCNEEELQAKRLHWSLLLGGFQRYGHYSGGNRITALEGGDCCYDEMLANIRGAKTRVWLETYIFDRSPVGQLFFEALRDAAKRGCDVVLLVDYIGSFSFPSDWVAELEEAGAEVTFFNPVLPASASVGPLSFRDHRKILICDDVGFCGGMNVQDDVGEEKYGSSKFYDVHAKLQGPCVADLAEVFRDTLDENGGVVVRPRIPIPEAIEGGCYVQVLQSNVRKRRRTLQKVITRSINAAEDSLYITTAYFFPPGFLRRALIQVPTRGAQLSLLLSGSSDFHPIPGDLLAQTHFLRRFFKDLRGHEQNFSVHLFHERHMHAKHMSVDGIFSYIGSFNYDLYSARRNLEVGIAVFDPGFANTLKNLHLRKVADENCHKSTMSDWWYQHWFIRFACASAYTFIRLSGRNFFDGLDCFQHKWLVRKAALNSMLEDEAAHFVGMSMMWGLD
mmetsp:Transcript_62335/g.136200  ORF Transcript_62335/g.136200 Transcript_62335/m.136200 type:complete len:503 (+) Transcript_62335:633-2141(+)